MPRMAVNSLFHCQEQTWCSLNLIQNDPISARPKRLRMCICLAERIEIIQAVEAPVFEWLFIEQQGAFSYLAGACKHDNGMILNSLLKRRCEPAIVI